MVPFRARLAAGIVVTALVAPGVTRVTRAADGSAPAVEPAADAPALVTRWLARQAGIKAWSADFTQTRSLKTLARPLVSRGKVWFAAPNRFRWQIGDPPQSVAVRTTNAVLVVYPPLRRAEKYPVDAAATGPWRHMLTLLEAGFPSTQEQLDQRFRRVATTLKDGIVRLELEPRQSAARRLMPRFTLEFTADQLALTATEMEFQDGSRLRNEFTAAIENPPLEEGLFEPALGPDYQVTEPLGDARP